MGPQLALCGLQGPGAQMGLSHLDLLNLLHLNSSQSVVDSGWFGMKTINNIHVIVFGRLMLTWPSVFMCHQTLLSESMIGSGPFPVSVRWSHRSSSWSGGAVATWMLSPGPVRSCSLLCHVKTYYATERSICSGPQPPPRTTTVPSAKWAACRMEGGFIL